MYGENVTSQVVVASFRSREESLRARRALESSGIAAEAGGRMEDRPRLAADLIADGFDVAVEAADADRAIALLHELWPDVRPERAAPRCPACGSPGVRRLMRLRIFAAAAVVLLAAGIAIGERDLMLLLAAILGLLLMMTPPLRCQACGESWRPDIMPAAEEVESDDAACPRCGSPDTGRIAHRREKALTLIVNLVVPPTFLVWPFLKRRRCAACGHEWR